MNLKTFLLLVGLIGLNSMFVPAQVITLNEIQKMAEANYPAIARYDIIEKTKEFSIANANRGFLPQGTLSAQATWQSDVTQIDMEIPEGMPPLVFPVPDQDQYRVVAELNQLMWDGGNISAQKKNLKAGAEVERKQLTQRFTP